MKRETKKLLDEIKSQNLAENVPSITEKNAKFIHFLLRLKKAKNVLEIGTCQGYSGIWISHAIAPFNGKLVTYEVSTPSIAKSRENFEKSGFAKNIELRPVNFLENPPDAAEKFDVIFVDAQKNKYHKFWQQIQQNTKDDSLIIIDDVLKFKEKTAEFTALMEQDEQYEKVVLPIDEDDGVMILQKKANLC